MGGDGWVAMVGGDGGCRVAKVARFVHQFNHNPFQGRKRRDLSLFWKTKSPGHPKFGDYDGAILKLMAQIRPLLAR